MKMRNLVFVSARKASAIRILNMVPLMIIAFVLGSFAQAADAIVYTLHNENALYRNWADVWATHDGTHIADSYKKLYLPYCEPQNVAFAGAYGGGKTVNDVDWHMTGGGIFGLAYDAGCDSGFSIAFLETLSPTGVTWAMFDSDTSALFCGVDLQAYHNAGGASYTSGETFQIVNGTSPQLPGMLFGSTDVTDTGSGFTTANPYTGSATVFGEQSLRTVPEAATLIVWSLLGMTAFAFGWGRRRKAV